MQPGTKKVIAAALILFALWLGIRYLLPLLLPFLLGAGLALIAEPMTVFFCRRLRLPRGIAAAFSVTAAFCFLALIFLLLCAMIVRELGILAGVLPDLEETAKSGIAMLSDWLLGLIRQMPDGIRSILERNITGFFSSGTALLDQAVRYVLQLASAILSHIPDSALTLGTGVVSSFMISAKLPRIRAWLAARFPKERLRPVLDALKQMKSAVGGWLLAQIKLSCTTWILVTLGFLILRVPYAPLWAMLVALVDAFPVLGTGTVLIPWALVSFLQGSVAQGIGLLGIYAAVALTRSILEPKLVGKQLGLDPLVTLIALYAGYKLWGLGGMLIAPMLAVTVRNLLPISAKEDKL